MRRIKLFNIFNEALSQKVTTGDITGTPGEDDFKDDFPFSLEEITDMFQQFEDEEFIVNVKPTKRATSVKYDEGKNIANFTFVNTILATLEPIGIPTDISWYNMTLIEDKNKNIFDNVIMSLKSRGCKVESKIQRNKFIFYIT